MISNSTEDTTKAVLTPEVIENASEVIKEGPKVAPEDQAAQTFSELIKTWKRLRKALNLGAYARVTEAILEFPLADAYPKFQSDKELQAFKVGCTILECKNFMISKVMEDRMTSEKVKKEAALTAESASITTQE